MEKVHDLQEAMDSFYGDATKFFTEGTSGAGSNARRKLRAVKRLLKELLPTLQDPSRTARIKKPNKHSKDFGEKLIAAKDLAKDITVTIVDKKANIEIHGSLETIEEINE